MSRNDFLTDYLQSLYGIEVLPTEREHELAALIAQGDQLALGELVKHNLRFVVYTVRKITAWSHSDVPQEDIISMGNEALIRAALQWVPTNNAKFATYAKPFILRGVERGLDNTENLVRIPIKVREELRKMLYTERVLRQALNRVPTAQELGQILGKSAKRINQLRFYVMQEPTSLEALNANNVEEEEQEN